MLQIHSWPNVILHIDGDAFFASVVQAANPRLKKKPVAVGKERGIATAVSYEAKQFGIKRGMRFFEIRKICPECICVESDYELYALFSKRMFEIIKQFSPAVEEYSIDEGFVDLKGLRRPLRMSYEQIGSRIKNTIESNLGISVSVGISCTKSLAKLASNFRKPSNLTVVNGRQIENFLQSIPIHKVWGIGVQTAAFLHKLQITTAFEFITQPEEFIQKRLSKPFFEIYQELRGKQIYMLNPEKKVTYQSISKTQTFHPATNNKNVLWARLLRHIEEAFTKARIFHYQVGKMVIFLKTQEFAYHATEIKFASKVAYPMLVRSELSSAFEKCYRSGVSYRTTGCTISDFEENRTIQQTLFQDGLFENKAKKIYPLLDTKKVDFATCLFDKEHVKEYGKKPALSLPVLSLE
ncbi:MAG: DNA polymerase IV [Patescibacteria group bacterium]